MDLRVFDNAQQASIAAALALSQHSGKNAIFGFATGNTPRGTYAELADRGGVQCKQAFALDEYVGIDGDDPRSFAHYMRTVVEAPLDLPHGTVRVPNGLASDLNAEAASMELAILQTPVDVQLLGLGRNGHIGFNEPGSRKDTLTRVVKLAQETRLDNGADFEGLAPERAITQGIGTILRAAHLILVATGAAKKEAVHKLLEGEEDDQWPVTHLAQHPNLLLLVDRAAVD